MIYQAQVKSAQATKWTTLKPDHSAFLDAFDQLVKEVYVKGGSSANQMMQIVKKNGSEESVIWKSY